MLGTIQFQNQAGFGAVKIHNIGTKDALPAKLNRIFSQKLIPQCIFFLSGLFAKRLRILCESFVLSHSVLQIDGAAPLIRHGFAVPPSPKGEGFSQGISFLGFMYRSSSEKIQPQYFCM